MSQKVTFYHGSYDYLPENTVLAPRGKEYEADWGESDFYQALEFWRPKNMRSHSDSVFLVDNLDDLCVAGGALEWVFECDIAESEVTKHDLNWSSEISCLMGDGYAIDSDKVQYAAKKYWSGEPHPNESVWEYLAPEARIIKAGSFDDFESSVSKSPFKR